jgi:hypothetical protein
MWRDTQDAVTIKYVAFDPQALVSDEGITLTEDEIRAYYRQHEKEFIRPARASVKYVLINRLPNGTDSTAALQRAERVRAELAAGADFGEVARAESSDTVSARDDGKLTITRGQAVPAFDQAAFAQRIGELSEPVLTQFGYHIMRTDSRSGDTAHVRHVLIPLDLTPAHEEVVLDQADSLDVLTETLKLEAIGQNLGMKVEQADLIPGLAFIPGVGDAADGAEWVFRTATACEVSEFFETPSAYYAPELIGGEEERTLTVEEAR